MKDNLECNVLGIYLVGCIVTARCKEHKHHILCHQPDKYTVAEHCIETNHKIDFDEATVLARSAGYIDVLVKEGTEIQLYCSSFIMGVGLMLSQA